MASKNALKSTGFTTKALTLAVRLDLFEHLQTIDLRQLEIEQHDGGIAGRALGMFAAPIQKIQRFRAVSRNDDFVGELTLGERRERQLQIAGIVFDEKNGAKVSHAALLYRAQSGAWAK
jgi:hypothetical protein